MTRYEKSDAQLDAEASKCADCDKTHRRCLFCREWHEHDLAARLACHRGASRDDNYLTRLTSTQPPLTRYEKSDDAGLIRYGANEEYVIEEGAEVGQPMAGPLLRRLSDHPGIQFPWVTAFGWLHWQCRLRHLSHRAPERPYWRGALCWEFVKLTIVGPERSRAIRGPLNVEQAADILRVDDVLGILGTAFDDIERHIEDLENKAERRQRDEQGRGPGAVPEYVPAHHAVPGLHEEECPQCRAA